MASKMVARGWYTLVELHDGKAMQLTLTCNHPTVQQYDQIETAYSPDYASHPLVVTPVLNMTGVTGNQAKQIVNPRWTINNEPISRYGAIAQTTPTPTLLIGHNMTDVNSFDICLVCEAVDPDTKVSVRVSANICISKQCLGEATPVMMLNAPNGNLFKNDKFAQLSAVAKLFVGADDITDHTKCTWYELKNIPVELIDTAFVYGQGTNTLTVLQESVTDDVTYECRMEYNNAVYSEFITFSRQTDNYTVEIENKNGDKMKNGVGEIYCEAHIFRGKERIPDAEAEKKFNFKWRRYNKRTGALDSSWRSPVSRTLVLNKNDVNTLSTFICEITAKNEAFSYILPFTLS